ncbi:putative ribonuclease H-like domain-containing protein [Tanacetum coccineum]
MTKTTNEQGFISAVYEGKTHEDLHTCLFAAYFLSQEEPKKEQENEIVARIEAIRLFLAYASFKDFVVYQMDVKSAFLYGKIERGSLSSTTYGASNHYSRDAEAEDVDVSSI